MRRKDRELLDEKDLYTILDLASEIRLGLWDGEEVYIVPLNFVRIESKLYIHSSSVGRKIDILRQGQRLCFEATSSRAIEPKDGSHCTTYFESVIGWGSAVFVEDAEKTPILNAFNRKYGAGEAEFPSELLSRTAVIKIGIDRMTGKAHRAQ
ncbi:pyridoxamine 5'-phosphate oxidase family protein [Treponema sp.]